MGVASTETITAWPHIDETLLSILLGADKILCVSHVAPDGDAVGSLLGMGWILRALHKDPTLALQDQPGDEFAIVPGYSEIIGPEDVEADYDLIICLDASSPDRMGAVFRAADHAGIPMIVIDHHITNTNFGAYNWVEPQCAATCQMLVYLADALDVPLAGNLAQALLTGLVTDTLGFRTSNTDARVMGAAMRLMDGGGDLVRIVDQTLRRTSYSMLKLWGEALSHTHLDNGIIWATISQDQRRAAGVSEQESDSLANHLVTAQEADISATFSERKDEKGNPAVECSFRAKQGFDVSAVAFSLGGGGHPPAAGCTVLGTLDEVPQKVIAALQSARQAQLSQWRSQRAVTEQMPRA
ncbi:MAG: DHH family phosphoesterase [Caldilineaceae bacterium]|nr:DHH family phosphoesterase [Caldilineaceae bacterium]